MPAYILCNFVPMELQEMYGRNFLQKILSTLVILSNFIYVTPLRAYVLFWKLKDLKLPNMNTFHCFELSHKPLNFSPSCPEYPWCTREHQVAYTKQFPIVPETHVIIFWHRSWLANDRLSRTATMTVLSSVPCQMNWN